MKRKLSNDKVKSSKQLKLSFPVISKGNINKSLESIVICDESNVNLLVDKIPLEKITFDKLELAMENEWYSILKEEWNKPYWKNIKKILVEFEKQKKLIFPPKELIFNAFHLCSWKNLRVVIIGQDPYHDNHQAHGLCFSVPDGITIPVSLKNIFKELVKDIPDFKIVNSGCLVKWAQQGILLINATLTVEAHKANSHSKIGWHLFTDAVIRNINFYHKNIVFLLWGAFAQKKGANIDQSKHYVLRSPHPSGLSATRPMPNHPTGFFNNHHFSLANKYLVKCGKTSINWNL